MWVLLFMLSLLVGLANRPKMLLIAVTFVAVEGIAYFAFMAAWLNMFLLIGLSRITELILGSIAGLAGVISIKDFWAFQRGISLSIPDAAKPGLYARRRRIIQAENIIAALIGTVMLALLVQAVELLCTAGLPALYTRILTMQQLDRWVYYGYLALYNVAYMLDDVLVLAIGVITMSHYRLQEREGRWAEADQRDRDGGIECSHDYETQMADVTGLPLQQEGVRDTRRFKTMAAHLAHPRSDSRRRLASTGSRGYSPPNPRNVTGLAKDETNGMSNGAATLRAASRVGD